jgi:hypothetical protein
MIATEFRSVHFKMSIARVISTQVIATITKGSRAVQVGYVDKTDIWTRSLLSEDVQQKFTTAAEGHIDTLRSDTKTVALQYHSLWLTLSR